MNYITRLQEELADANAALAAKAEALQEFRVHLGGDKFAGFETDGGRKDWIAVGDVNGWLARIAGGSMSDDNAQNSAGNYPPFQSRTFAHAEGSSSPLPAAWQRNRMLN